jgi:hypothetical protein
MLHKKNVRLQNNAVYTYLSSRTSKLDSQFLLKFYHAYTVIRRNEGRGVTNNIFMDETPRKSTFRNKVLPLS